MLILLARFNAWAIAALLIACLAPSATAQDFQPLPEQLAAVPTDLAGHPKRPNAMLEKELADDADGAIEFSATVIADWSSNFQGGANTNGSAFRHLFDANLTFDLNKLVGIEGATFFLDFYNIDGAESGAEDVGDAQGFSNIEDAGRTQLAEAWWLQEINSNLSIKLGKIEANADFAFTDNGGEFINSSAGFSPTILGLVSYPDPSMGAVIFFSPVENWYTNFGIFDGSAQEGVPTGKLGPNSAFTNPADMILNGEIGKTWDGGRLSLGIWAHTGTFDRFGGGTDDGTEGFYITYDQSLWAENPNDEDDEQGIALFVQYGWADDDVSEIDNHIGVGLNWVGPIAGRDDDATGIMVSNVSFASGAGFTDNSETAVELFYKIQINDNLSIKPDLQYISNPGGDGKDDALVGTLRAEISF